VNSEIDRNTFCMQIAEYTEHINKLNNQLTILQQTEQSMNTNKQVGVLAKKAMSKKSTLGDIVNALIEKVYVYPDNCIEIRWKFDSFAEGM